MTKPAPSEVLSAVERVWGLDYGVVTGKCRAKRVYRARACAVWLLRTHLQLSYPAIGRVMQRDHTTCMHAMRRAEGWQAEDPLYARADELAGMLLRVCRAKDAMRSVDPVDNCRDLCLS